MEPVGAERLSREVARTDGRRVTSYEPLVDGFLPGVSAASGRRGAGAAAIGRPADVLQLPDGSILISDDRAIAPPRQLPA